MQNKGVVMQVADGFAVVMTKECEFRKIPLVEGMVIGQEVEVPAEVVVPLSGGKRKNAWYRQAWAKTGMVAASVLLAAGLWTSQGMFTSPKAYAYVSVDINPSIELSIDNRKQVVTAEALNAEGEQVVAALKLTGMTVEEAVGKLADYARTQGYLHDKSEVIITASPAVDEQQLVAEDLDLDKIESELVTKVETLAQDYGTEIEVEGIRVSEGVRTAAQEAGVSPGKYALYLSALSNGIDVEIDEIKTQPISKIVEAKGTQMAEVLHGIKGGEQLDGMLDTLKTTGKDGLHKAAQNAIVPNNNSTMEREDKKTPPGQAKKEDAKQDESKKNDAESKANKPDDSSNNREQGSQGQGNGKGQSSKSDDKGNSDRSQINSRSGFDLPLIHYAPKRWDDNSDQGNSKKSTGNDSKNNSSKNNNTKNNSNHTNSKQQSKERKDKDRD